MTNPSHTEGPMTSTCRWVASDQPRVLPGRHVTDCAGETCTGCLPCTEPHCTVCRRVHADGACAECIAATRDDLREIAALCGALPAEVEHRGINGEAMMLLGPSADPEAWRNRAMSAMRGRLCKHGLSPCPDDLPMPEGPTCEQCKHATCRILRGDIYRCEQKNDYLGDCRDEQHPLWVLGSWEQVWRDHLDQPTGLAATLPRLVDYLDAQMHIMAAEAEVPFEDFARDLRGCRGHLEDVLHDGEQVEKGAPCPKCDRPLVKKYGRNEHFDRWECPSRKCGEWYLDHEYRRWVTDDYRANADKLTAQDIAAEHGIPAGSVRGWASLGKVRKRGKDSNGRQLYDVADVLKMRDGAVA